MSIRPDHLAPGSAPAFDARAFRNALGSFPTGVAIITTLDAEGQPVGLTCNSFSSVSLEPPLVSWGLRLSSRSLAAFQHGAGFVINVLADDQKDLSDRFASGAITDKFAGVAWSRGLNGLPLIDDCVASFECSRFAEHVAGDHVLFLGQVQRCDQRRQDASLVFYRGAYMMLSQSLRELAARGRMEPADLDQARRLVNCMLLRLACENGTEEDFQAIEDNVRQIEALDSTSERDQRSEASVEFFRLITRAAHNDVLVAVADTLTTILRHALKSEFPRPYRPELVPVRLQILQHLRMRNPQAAEQAMTHYFDELRRLQARN